MDSKKIAEQFRKKFVLNEAVKSPAEKTEEIHSKISDVIQKMNSLLVDLKELHSQKNKIEEDSKKNIYTDVIDAAQQAYPKATVKKWKNTIKITFPKNNQPTSTKDVPYKINDKLGIVKAVKSSKTDWDFRGEEPYKAIAVYVEISASYMKQYSNLPKYKGATAKGWGRFE